MNSHMLLYEEKDLYQPPLVFRRFLVLTLYFSFLACLAAFWLTGTVFGGPNQILPFWFMDVIQDNRPAILLLPLVVLLACSITLYHLTGHILAGPDRYLDERQRMLRDQAHRCAYRIIKFACLLVPLGFLLQVTLWPGPGRLLSRFWFLSLPAVAYPLPQGFHPWTGLPTRQYSVPWPDNPASLAIYGGALFLCLFLMVTLLPRSILAWKVRP